MARDDWRIRIELEEEHAGGFSTGSAAGSALAPATSRRSSRRTSWQSSRDDDTLFVYAASREQARQAQKIIEAELEEAGIEPRTVELEHWLADEERWDDEPKHETWEEEVLEEGYSPWEVRVELASHEDAEKVADELEQEGLPVARRWRYLVVGASSEEEAKALAKRLHGTVEAGGEVVYEAMPHNPFAIFGGLGGYPAAGTRAVAARSDMLRSAPPAGCRGRTFSKSSTGACCAHAQDHRPADESPVRGGRPGGHGDPSHGLGRRAFPPRRRGSRSRARARNGSPTGAGRGDRRDRVRPGRADAGLEGPLRAHARARARAQREATSPRVRHGAPQASDRRARRDAHRTDRRQPERAENGNGHNGHAEPALDDEEDEDEELDGQLEEEIEEPCRRPGRRPPVPLPPPDRVGQDDRRRRIRRGGAVDRSLDSHAPPAAREPVPARADRRGLRRPPPARDPRLEAATGRTRSRSRPTPGSRGTSATYAATRTSS